MLELEDSTLLIFAPSLRKTMHLTAQPGKLQDVSTKRRWLQKKRSQQLYGYWFSIALNQRVIVPCEKKKYCKAPLSATKIWERCITIQKEIHITKLTT